MAIGKPYRVLIQEAAVLGVLGSSTFGKSPAQLMRRPEVRARFDDVDELEKRLQVMCDEGTLTELVIGSTYRKYSLRSERSN